jgi:hypothetical protein
MVVAGALTVSPSARAQEFTRRSFMLDDGDFALMGEPARPKILGIGLNRNDVGNPSYLAPHFYWGVTDDVMLGITHERGLCFSGCEHPYNDAGFGMLIFLTDGPKHELDLHLGVPVHSFDPFSLGFSFGVLGRVNIGSVTALVFDPHLHVGIVDSGNGLSLPIWFYFQAGSVVVPFVGTALNGPFEEFGDRFEIPLEGGILFTVSQNVDIGFVLRFGNPLGRGGSFDWREIGFIGRFVF